MLNSPMPLPTSVPAVRCGRVLDVGAGSGRAAIGVLIARPHVTATGVDIYSGYWGIDGNTPERFMANARIAGVAERASARVGDMRQLPFGDGEFDAVVSSYAIDHLRRAERPESDCRSRAGPQAGRRVPADDHPRRLEDMARLPLLAHHPRRTRNPGANCLRRRVHLEEEGTRSRHSIFLRRSRAPGRRSELIPGIISANLDLEDPAVR